jgi:hypothetical protein
MCRRYAGGRGSAALQPRLLERRLEAPAEPPVVDVTAQVVDEHQVVRVREPLAAAQPVERHVANTRLPQRSEGVRSATPETGPPDTPRANKQVEEKNKRSLGGFQARSKRTPP